MAQGAEENTVSIVLLGSDVGIKGGGHCQKRTGKVVSVPVGDALIGRVVNALGQPSTYRPHRDHRVPRH